MDVSEKWRGWAGGEVQICNREEPTERQASFAIEFLRPRMRPLWAPPEFRNRIASARLMIDPVARDPQKTDAPAQEIFRFRPWVGRAGLSIVAVSAAATAAIVAALYQWPASRFGWIGERFVWVYLGTLWIGGLKVWLGSRGIVAELRSEQIVLRPLHTFRARSIPWTAVRGIEQTIGGDRLIVYHDTHRGMRFVALNLNLIRGRREFLSRLDQRLRAMGFVEKIVERSRYLTAPSLPSS